MGSKHYTLNTSVKKEGIIMETYEERKARFTKILNRIEVDEAYILRYVEGDMKELSATEDEGDFKNYGLYMIETFNILNEIMKEQRR